MALITVMVPGLMTTVQDLGRWGWQARGVSVAGPMDPWSHRAANVLVGNDADAATLEMTFSGPELTFDDERTAVIAGADFEATVDGRPVPIFTPFQVSVGSILRVGRCRRDCRAYLAVAGGITVPRVLGSRATHLPSGIGGVEGRALRAGDQLPLGEQRRHRVMSIRPAYAGLPHSSGAPTLRVIPGPDLGSFAQRALDVLQSTTYTVDPASDRMGFRLTGPTLPRLPDANVISDAAPLGALQVPESGQPILLMADRPTSGGYPILGTLISADVSLAGQLGPGDAVRFAATSEREAVAALIAQERTLMALAEGR